MLRWAPKLKFLCFAMFALFPKFGARTRTQDLWPFLVSETRLKFLIWTQGKIHPGNRASPVNRAHMKRPSIGSHRSMRVMTSFMATTTLRRSAILCKDYGTEDWQQSLWLACYVSLWYMIHFGGHLTLSRTTRSRILIARQLFTTHRVWYEYISF